MNTLTVILGASPQPERYSYLALRTLVDRGLPFALLNPRYETIDGYPVLASVNAVTNPIGTVSMYLAPERQAAVVDDLLRAHPKRVIFNPGSENPPLKTKLEEAGIRCLEACTLVLLRTGQF